MTATRVKKRARTPEAVKAYRKKLRRGMSKIGTDLRKEIRKDINTRATSKVTGGTRRYERAQKGAPPRRESGDLWRSVRKRVKSKASQRRISLFIETLYYGRFLERKHRTQRGDHPFISPVLKRRRDWIVQKIQEAGRA